MIDMEKADSVIKSAIRYVNELFQANADGHDASHTLRVYSNAMYIAKNEPGGKLRVIALAALLHDADDSKLFKTDNNANARHFLASAHVDATEADSICEVINAVSFSKNRGRKPATLEGKIVQDADRLDAIGAVGIARAFAFGGSKGRSIEASCQHFYEKLLLIKDELNTKTALQLAESRHSFMESFLVELTQELCAELPEATSKKTKGKTENEK